MPVAAIATDWTWEKVSKSDGSLDLSHSKEFGPSHNDVKTVAESRTWSTSCFTGVGFNVRSIRRVARSFIISRMFITV
jgi:hypothetical protein